MHIVWLIIVSVVPFQRNLRSIHSPPAIDGESKVLSFSSLIDNSKYEKKEYINAGLGHERILYEDQDIVIANKPTYLQTVPGYDESTSLATSIQTRCNIAAIEHMTPHRLDYQTSGIVVLTKNLAALKSLQQQFREGMVYKRYTAIVHGHLETLEGEIDLPIGKDPHAGPPLQGIDVINGKGSLTHYHVRETWKDLTVLSLLPQTGR
jgi:23S rRNA-/tRNA-specific pseudouridylate synthase